MAGCRETKSLKQKNREKNSQGAQERENLRHRPKQFLAQRLLIRLNHILYIEKGHERMKLTVASPIASSFADLALTTRVRGALQSDPRTRHSGIEVKCVDGTVTLRGEVPKAETALFAQQIALAVGGVDLVHTDIKWAQEPLIKV
jgi:hypothetical protein